VVDAEQKAISGSTPENSGNINLNIHEQRQQPENQTTNMSIISSYSKIVETLI